MGKVLTHFEGLIIVPMLVLTGFSLAVIGSISPELLRQQMQFFLLGWALFFSLSFTNLPLLKSLIWPAYFIAVLALAATFFGPNIRGATRWIELSGVRFQPSELIKPVILMSQAFFLSRYHPRSAKNLALFFAIFIVPIVITFRQPDLGNSIIFATTAVGLLFMAGIPSIYLVGLVAVLSVFSPLIWLLLKGYQRLRIMAFVNPYLDTVGAGYNAIQAMIAIGSGQLFGRGLGRGPQSQLRFLPENHTDFIFASLTEELGFFAASLMLFSYFILLLILLRQARSSADEFTSLFLFGVFVQLFLHVAINVGMNLGLLPITGITLPLLSYGGSSILATFSLLGLVNAITGRQKVSETIAIG